MSDKKYLLILMAVGTILQLPPLAGGFELCDSGFYLTFYDNIFSAPDTVEYNFMYYLSGIAGGLVLEMFPDSILALRVTSLICNLVCIYCMWAMARSCSNYKVPLAVAVVTILVGLWFVPLTFYYDTITALFVCVSMLLLWRGVLGMDGFGYILASGFLTGLNLFSRVANVLDFSFILLIPVLTRVIHGKYHWRPCIHFAAGWLSGILVVVVLMLSLGHASVFLANMQELFSIAAAEGDEASHGIGNLISAQFNAWLRFLQAGWKLIVVAILSVLVSNSRFGLTAGLSSTVRFYINAGLLAVALYVISRVDALTAILAITFPSLVFSLIFASDPKLRALSWIGLATMIVIPLGSDGGIYNPAVYAVWLGVGPAMIFMNDTTRLCHLGNFHVPYMSMVAIGVTILVSGIVRMNREGLYFDDTPLMRMTAEIDSPRARNIHTSINRAKIVEDMLMALDGVVMPGDTMMVYGSAPSLNWLTATHPALGVSWPEQLSADALRTRLDSEDVIRYIMLMKFNAIGSRWGEPSPEYVNGYDGMNIYHTPRKSRVILDYISTHGYTPVVDSKWFTLYCRGM